MYGCLLIFPSGGKHLIKGFVVFTCLHADHGALLIGARSMGQECQVRIDVHCSTDNDNGSGFRSNVAGTVQLCPANERLKRAGS